MYITLNFRCECPSYSTLNDNACVVFLTTSVTILKLAKLYFNLQIMKLSKYCAPEYMHSTTADHEVNSILLALYIQM